MKRFLLSIGGICLVAALVISAAAAFIVHQFAANLPDHSQLSRYEPPVTTRLHAGDGKLLAEFAIEPRLFVPLEAIPGHVIQAFLAAEDKDFREHSGIDPMALMRAAFVNLRSMLSSSPRRPVGGSTITQQVAKNFLLSNEVSITRKVKEGILAVRLERTLSKDTILELYLNQIYLGYASYGVAAAAINYFNKSLDELTLAEAAYLAVLPKAPNNYHPVRRKGQALERRAWVLDRMVADGRITVLQAEEAKDEPLTVRSRLPTEFFEAQWFAEEVRRELYALYGKDKLYTGGLSVRTTIEPTLQGIGETVLREGILAYDRRHGWRGPITRLKGDIRSALAAAKVPPALAPFRLAAVTDVSPNSAEILLKDGTKGLIALAEAKWARPTLRDQRFGFPPKNLGTVLAKGDLIAVEPLPAKGSDGKAGTPDRSAYALRQIPNIDGALVALDPNTGRVLAMVGGYSTDRSEFNRATQAARQPGSAFKPFVYLAALEKGYTPATLVMDAPVVVDQGPHLPLWKPRNYSRKFYGRVPMRMGIERSRNLMTVRIAQDVGMEAIAGVAERFGITPRMPKVLSMSLGAGETTLHRLTAAYAMLANGGRRITPTIIDRVQDRHGRTVFRHDDRPCPQCTGLDGPGPDVPEPPDRRERLTDPLNAYQIVSMLEGVVQRGTGRSLRRIGKPLAGKTGTTNNSFDTWFIGFAPDLAVGVFVGFDTPRTLGRRETGSSVAVPIFGNFMAEALQLRPATPFRIPSGMSFMRVSRATGRPAGPDDKDAILEAFKPAAMAKHLLPTGGKGAITDEREAGRVPGLY